MVKSYKKKILWISDFHTSGYSNVSKGLIQKMSFNKKYEFHILVINNLLNIDVDELADILKIPDDHIHTCEFSYSCNQQKIMESEYKQLIVDRLIGLNNIKSTITSINPDIVVSINDKQVLERQFLAMKGHRCKKIGYMPIDCSTFPMGFFDSLNGYDCLWTMYGNGRNEIIKTGYKKPVFVLEHAINDSFYICDASDYRKTLFHEIKPTDKIIINSNVHSNRKRIDLTLIIFEKLCSHFSSYNLYNPYYLIMKTKNENSDGGDTLSDLIKSINILSKSRIKIISNRLSDDELNNLYNATDICINTTNGEGWGLIPFEFLKLNKHCVVPDNTSYSELFPKSMLVSTKKMCYVNGRTLTTNNNDICTINIISAYPSLDTSINVSKKQQSIIPDCDYYIISETQSLNDLLKILPKQQRPFSICMQIDHDQESMTSRMFRKTVDDFHRIRNFETYLSGFNAYIYDLNELHPFFVTVDVIDTDIAVKKLIDINEKLGCYGGTIDTKQYSIDVISEKCIMLLGLH